MEVNAKSLQSFDEWLAEAGRGEGTRRLYKTNVNSCAAHDRGMLGRLTEDDSALAAKTLHTNKAALEAWATFAGDKDLLLKLKRLRLPPAVRARPKRELEQPDWRGLVDAIHATKMPPAHRSALLIMARRGLRIADVLRIRRPELGDALRTGRLSYVAKGRRRLEYNAGSIRDALEELSKHPGDWERVEDLVVSRRCLSTGGRRRHQAGKCLRRSLARAAKRAGIAGVHPHRLRRTYAVLYVRELAGDPQALMKLQNHMGWASMATAAQYIDAVNREELDGIGERMVERALGAGTKDKKK